MAAILIQTEGKLTKKQEKSMEIVRKIILVLIKEEPLDWKRLLEKKVCSKGALDKWLKELIRQNVVEGKIRVVNNRFIPFFTYTRKFFFMKGKEETSVREACRVWFSEKKGIVGYQWGYLKKGRGNSRYFVPEKGFEKPIPYERTEPSEQKHLSA